MSCRRSDQRPGWPLRNSPIWVNGLAPREPLSSPGVFRPAVSCRLERCGGLCPAARGGPLRLRMGMAPAGRRLSLGCGAGDERAGTEGRRPARDAGAMGTSCFRESLSVGARCPPGLDRRRSRSRASGPCGPRGWRSRFVRPGSLRLDEDHREGPQRPRASSAVGRLSNSPPRRPRRDGGQRSVAAAISARRLRVGGCAADDLAAPARASPNGPPQPVASCSRKPGEEVDIGPPRPRRARVRRRSTRDRSGAGGPGSPRATMAKPNAEPSCAGTAPRASGARDEQKRTP